MEVRYLFINSIQLKKGIWVALGFSILILIIFYVLNKKKVDQRIESFLKKISEKKKKRKKRKEKVFSSPKEELYVWAKSVKRYLKNYLKLEKDLTLTEIADILRTKRRNKKRENLAKLCEKLNYYLYSNEKVSKKDIDDLKKEFRELKK